ncbi:MAG: hypothetical protein ACKVQB_02700 [Bacteroidia bacterium]
MQNLKTLTVALLLLSSTFLMAQTPNPDAQSKKIQVLICLDVSGSMSGLIDQAKDQLWNMVSILGKAKNPNYVPQIEIALYEYGRPGNGVNNGYVKRINGFSTDLDQVSKNLFALTIDGGDEFCGHVMYTALNELNWDTSAKSYKVIFIAGNEDFYQGSISYTKACALASKKGVIVNTIYCGDKMQGIREHWNLGGECGQGSFTNIDQNVTVADVATPYDSSLFALNDRLNTTYVSYGAIGVESYSKQAEVDKMNYSKNKSAAIKRVSVKGKGNLYKNSTWDLVDAHTDDSTIVNKIDKKTLPDSLKTKSTVEIQQIVKVKKEERVKIQKDIETLNKQRQVYITTEKTKTTTGTSSQQTLESEVEKIIVQQAKKFDLVIE